METFKVKIANTVVGQEPDEVIVESSLHQPDSVEIRWQDPGRTMIAPYQIGQPMTVEGTAGETNALPLAEVEITAFDAILEGGRFFSVVRGLDKTHRLHRGTMSSTFLNMKGSEIVSQVAQKAGVPTGKIETTDVEFEAFTQLNETPWQFFQRLGLESNRTVTVGAGGKVSFIKPIETTEAPDKSAKDDRVLRVGHNVLFLHATVSAAQQVAEVEVIGYDPSVKKAVAASKASKSVMAKGGKAITPSSIVTKFGKAKQTVFAPHMRTSARANAAAAALGERLASGMFEIHGEGPFNPHLRAGVAITLVDAGPMFDRSYVLTAVRHIRDQAGGTRTEFTVSGAHDSSLLGIINGASGGGSTGRNRRLPGVYPAIVTNNKYDKSKEPRVKVALPWLLPEESVEMGWVRVVHPAAGKDRGLFALPSVNDEVLVAFEYGDESRPVVLGGLYNQIDVPPQHPGGDKLSNAGKTNQMTLASEKHMLHMVDKDKSSQQTLTLGTRDNKFVITLTTDKGGLVSITSKGKVAITAANDITIASKTKVDIQGKEVSIQAQMGLTATGMTAKLGGSTKTAIAGAKIDIG